MSKNNRRAQPTRRSWLQQSAYRTGGGIHKDRRAKRQGTRVQQTARVVQEA